MNPYYMQQVEKLLRSRRVKLSTPIDKMPDDLVRRCCTAPAQKQRFTYESRSGHSWSYEAQFEGVVNNLQRRYGETSSDLVKEDIERFMSANTCKTCNGARLKPEALAVTMAGDEHRQRDEDVGRARGRILPRLRADPARGTDRAPDPQRDSRAAGLSAQRRPRLPEPRAQRDDALGRRVAADSSGDPDRQLARRRVLHPRRTVDRAASARQRPAARDAEDAARSRQHADRDRARRGHDARGGRHRRHRSRRRRRGRRDPDGRSDRRGDRKSQVADRRVPGGRQFIAIPRTAGRRARGCASTRPTPTTSAISTSTFRSACSPA